MKIIPPKLKILAGFKADDDVTIDQVIAALEKKQEGSRQAKFQSLISKRARELPNESYEDHFIAVMVSDEGQELFHAMHRAGVGGEHFVNEPPIEVLGFRTKEEARQKFQAHVDELMRKGFTRDDSWRTAAGTEPGKSAYLAWKTFASAERPEIIREHPPTPSAALIQKTREAILKREAGSRLKNGE